MKISAIWDADSVCHLHRTRLPFTHLQQDYPEHEFELSLIDVSPDVDVLWLYGAYKLDNLKDILKLKRRGVKLVVGLDDNYWDFPEWRFDTPSDDTVAAIEALTTMADHVVVTTEALKKRVGQEHKTTIGPNLLEVVAYHTKTPPEDDDIIRIMWAGGASHKGDLAVIDNACCEVLKRAAANHYGKRVEFVFVGFAPDKVLRDYWQQGVNYIKWVPLSQYFWTLHSIKPHITLAPLAKCAFNDCKSGIRCQEAWALHSALVYTPTAEYDNVCMDGITGLKADSTEEWISQIERLIDSRELREQLATNGNTDVKTNWHWRSPSARALWHPTINAILRLQDK